MLTFLIKFISIIIIKDLFLISSSNLINIKSRPLINICIFGILDFPYFYHENE